MKKTGIVALLAIVLVMTMLLTSCGGSIGAFSSFDKVLNPDFDITEKVWMEAKAIPELEGYALQEQLGDIAILYKMNEETGVLAYKIFNLSNASVILTFAAENIVYDFNTAYEELGLILVTETYFYDTEDLSELPTFAHLAYDKMGNEISRIEDADPIFPFMLGELVVYDDVAYKMDRATGALTKEMDIPEYMVIDADQQIQKNDDYYYVLDDDRVFVYDLSFHYVSSWIAPSYAEMNGGGVLNNGDILLQYAYELDEDAKEFDFYEANNGRSLKYDLVTLLINPKNGSAKEIDLKYVIENVVSNVDSYDEEEDNNYFNDSFDNIAYIYPIVNQKIDSSDAAADIVLMSDKGKIKKSLKLVDGQMAVLPEKVAEDTYSVAMLHGGFALIDIDGNVLKMINSGSDFEVIGDYFVSEKAIYDLNFEVIYSLKDNNARSLGSVDGTVFVREGTDDAYTVYAFRDGEKKTVFTYNVENTDNGEFEIVYELGYAIVNAAGDHTYYNAKGDLLITTTSALTRSYASENGALYVAELSIDNILKPTYYVFTK